MRPERWRLVKRIAADAFERPPAERSELVIRACGEDHELRAEVERLLRAHQGPPILEGLLELAAPSEAARSAAETPLLSKVWRGPAPSSGSAELAPEVMRRAVERLRLVALTFALGFVGVHLLNELLVHGASGTPYEVLPHWPSLLISTLAVAIGLALYLRIRGGRVAPAAVVRVGLRFEVVGGFAMALSDYAAGPGAGPSIMDPLWLCVWLIAFPFVVPAPPRQAAVAALATAAMAPAAMAGGVALGAMEWPPPAELLAELLPVFVCAGLATILGRVVYRMGTDLRRAQRLGSYQLVSPLGRGGMGEVWVARHWMLARPAALKLIRPEVLWEGGGFEGALQRFELEAQNTAALTSPHTVELYDYGATDDGVLFYAMELLDGLDLESLVRRHGPVEPGRAIHFLIQVCHSLAEAHERGLVHRDIKPANIYVCRQGLEHDFVKVLDFGLVARHGEEPGAAVQPLAGTPGFMAPETIARGEVGPAADLYALGCVAYWLLTGSRVFAGDGRAEILAAHLEAPPEPPSRRASREIPPSLDALVLACLAKEPSVRPPAAEALRRRLESEASALPWSQERARAWWRERAPGEPPATASLPGP